MKTSTSQRLGLLAASVALLAACSGGGTMQATAPAPTPAVPADTANTGNNLPSNATQSVAGLIDFGKSQLAATSDTAEPLLITDAVLPFDDTIDPSEL